MDCGRPAKEDLYLFQEQRTVGVETKRLSTRSKLNGHVLVSRILEQVEWCALDCDNQGAAARAGKLEMRTINGLPMRGTGQARTISSRADSASGISCCETQIE